MPARATAVRAPAGGSSDVLAMARAGRVRSNLGGAVTPAQLQRRTEWGVCFSSRRKRENDQSLRIRHARPARTWKGD